MTHQEMTELRTKYIEERMRDLKCPHCHRSLVSDTVRGFAGLIWDLPERLLWGVYVAAKKYIRAGSDWQELNITKAELRRKVSELEDEDNEGS